MEKEIMICANPECKAELDHKTSYAKGEHQEHTCKCGQLHQWHEHVNMPRPGHLMSGGPLQECKCGEEKYGALVPLLRRMPVDERSRSH